MSPNNEPRLQGEKLLTQIILPTYLMVNLLHVKKEKNVLHGSYLQIKLHTIKRKNYKLSKRLVKYI